MSIYFLSPLKAVKQFFIKMISAKTIKDYSFLGKMVIIFTKSLTFAQNYSPSGVGGNRQLFLFFEVIERRYKIYFSFKSKNAQMHYFMLQKNYILFVGLTLFSLSLFFSCEESKDKNIPDVSEIAVSLKVNRFEQELFAIDTNNVVSGIKKLEKKYPQFADFYFKQVLQLKKPWDTTGVYRDYVNGFLTYPFVRTLHHTVDSTYKDFSKIEKDLKKGLQFYKYYFPEKAIPQFYTFVSEFTYGIVLPPDENSVAIGLDFFLGEEYPYYYFPPLNLPKYVARTQDKNHLVAKVFGGLTEDLVGLVKGSRFIDYIIHKGKKIYLLDQLLPFEQDSIKLGYTTNQTKWCEKNEMEIWTYILQQELMYSNQFQDFKTLISIAPHAMGMPNEAPGQVGNWMGWQIVKAYMKQHPETTLQELIVLEDVQEILNKSRYKPKR